MSKASLSDRWCCLGRWWHFGRWSNYNVLYCRNLHGWRLIRWSVDRIAPHYRMYRGKCVATGSVGMCPRQCRVWCSLRWGAALQYCRNHRCCCLSNGKYSLLRYQCDYRSSCIGCMRFERNLMLMCRVRLIGNIRCCLRDRRIPNMRYRRSIGYMFVCLH